MLTDFSFLEKGRPWLPTSERDRIRLYRENRQLFDGEHQNVYRESLKRIDRIIGNFSEIINFTTIFAFQQLQTLKIADLLFGETPTISANGEFKDLAELVQNSGLWNICYECAIDVSRYGTGILVIENEDGKNKISITQPEYWFPVVEPGNIKKIIAHCLAWEYEVGDDRFLQVYVHRKGVYTDLKYELQGGSIGRIIENTEIKTNLPDFAVIPIHNVMTSDRAYGIDDYTKIDSIISEIMVRVGQISRILDKHASPSMQGPETALERDPETGEWKIKAGNYFITESDSREVSYITWNGQIEAAFKQIELLTNQLYMISEMGSAIFGDVRSGSGGQIASGTALRRLMVSALAKVNRIRMRFDPALKNAISLCSLSGYSPVQASDISIEWRDGLPDDPLEEAQIVKLRTESGTISKKRALIVYDKMTKSDAEIEIEQIEMEMRGENPILTNYSFGDDDE